VSDESSDVDGDTGVELTTEQDAALTTDAHVAVTAGAGTGKTTTLTSRYVRLLADGVDPREILTITFTNDAAGELRERVRAAVDERLDAAIERETTDDERVDDGERRDGERVDDGERRDSRETDGERVDGRKADRDELGYDGWRSVADAMEDAYVHTIHESCARLRTEFAVAANVHPDAETLDESDAGVLARRTVRESVGAMLDSDDDRHADVTRLGRLWSRSELETVLVGLVESRPESREWVDRWRGAPAGAHADAAWRALYPVSVATARDRLGSDRAQSALATITEIDPDALGIDGDDSGAEFVRVVQSVCRQTGVVDGTATGRDWQLALDRLCDRLTTGDRDPYTGRSVHYYRGAKSTWSAHEATQERLERAGKTLIDVLEPGETPFVGGTHADENAAPYLDALARVTDRVLTAYAARKRDRTALDFDDLVADTVRLLREEKSFRAAVREQFDYVLVDEMQDTDGTQWELVQLLAGADPAEIRTGDVSFDANLFLVGDEKQSIYRFRGADVTTFGAARETLATANGAVNDGRGRETTSDTDETGVDTADGGVDTADGGVDMDETGVDTADGGVDTADGGVDTADGGVDTADGGVDTADGRVDTVDAGVDTDHARLELSGSFRTLDTPRLFCNETFGRLFEPIGDERAPFEATPQALSAERTAGADRPGTVEYLFVPDDDDRAYHETGYFDHDAVPSAGDTATREATAVAARLSRLLADPPTVYDDDTDTERPARPEDVTVLLRARTRLPEYERALDAVDVPYTVASGTGFWDTPEIRTLVGLLEVLADPTDDTALYGLLRSPVFGFTDDTLARPTASDGSLWATLRAVSDDDADSTVDVPDDLAAAAEQVADWRTRVGLADASAEGDTDIGRSAGTDTGDDVPSWGQFLSRVVTESGYLGALAAGERPQQAVANVEQFREQIRDWADGGAPTLAGLLTRVRDRRAVESHAAQATVPDDVDGVRLRTIHSAKGLEFPVVVVPEIGREFVFGASADDDGKVYLDRVGVDDTGNANGDSEGPSGDSRNMHSDTADAHGDTADAHGDTADAHGDTADAHGDSGDANDETVPLLGIKAPSPDDAYDHVGTLARRGLRDRDRRRERAEQRRLLYVAATRTRDHLLLSGHHSVDDGEPVLDDPKPCGDARRWRDWLAPLLLGDGTLRQPDEDDAAADARTTATADTLASLRADGVVARSLGDADYTVRVPPEPNREWRTRRSDELGSAEPTVPSVDTASVDRSAPPVATTATTYAETVAPEIERDSTADDRAGGADLAAFGLDGNERGTVVHELLERRPPRDDWRGVARRRASGLGDPTDADVDAICEHAARGLASREALVDRVDPASVHEELAVTARFDNGRVVGEIDLLAVADDRYVVLDYKTDTADGVAVDDLAATHWPQLRVYAAALAERDDDRDVELRLCFTDVTEADGRVRTQTLDALDLADCRDEIEQHLAERRSSHDARRRR